MISAVVQVADRSQDDWTKPDRTSMYHYDFGDGCMKQVPQPPTSGMENRAIGTFRGKVVTCGGRNYHAAGQSDQCYQYRPQSGWEEIGRLVSNAGRLPGKRVGR